MVAAQRPDLLALATCAVGVDPFTKLDCGTAYLQPAIYCASLAGWKVLKRDVNPSVFAGHSLGEFAALAMAGSMSDQDALRLVVLRGELTQEAAIRKPGGMLILKAGATDAARLAAEHGVQLANDNSASQTVLSGALPALNAVAMRARELNIRSVRLATAVPFHSEAMRDAADQFAQALARTEMSPPSLPVISATTAKPFADIRRELAEALVRPVRWREVLHALERASVDCFVETGPGRVLTRLVQATIPGAIAWSVDDDRKGSTNR